MRLPSHTLSTNATATNLLAYGLIGGFAYPIAMHSGELLAGVFCVAATLAYHLIRKHRGH
jgi:ABC-type thiamin/hydroxymethylpyrimidine transport system permease subunit